MRFGPALEEVTGTLRRQACIKLLKFMVISGVMEVIPAPSLAWSKPREGSNRDDASVGS